jgi:hypothetical protein
MAQETLDNGVIISDEVADKLVADVYAALEKGAYRVIPNPHKKNMPVKLSKRLQSELQRALFNDE